MPTITSVTITPATASSITSGTLPFTAGVQGTSTNKAVTWKAALGTITSSGLYTAPSSPGTDTVTATSSADPTKSASASVKARLPARRRRRTHHLPRHHLRLAQDSL